MISPAALVANEELSTGDCIEHRVSGWAEAVRWIETSEFGEGGGSCALRSGNISFHGHILVSHVVIEAATVLQEAICATAEEEYGRLSAGKTPSEQLNCIARALEALGALREGTAPAYDEWQALFYITWYQYAHVNLGGAVLHDLFRGEVIPRPIQIIDFGCGAMALQLAVGIYAGARLRPGMRPPRVYMNNIDPSCPMRRIGRMVWERFCALSRGNSELTSISTACTWVGSDSRSMSTPEAIETIDPSAHCALVAMHAIYEKNKTAVKDSIERVRSRFSPTDIVMTCYDRSAHLAKFVCGEDLQHVHGRQWMFDLAPDKITGWRRGLLPRLPYVGDDHVSWKFLNRRVPKTPSSSIVLRWRSGDRR